jgi:hypothetical protein
MDNVLESYLVKLGTTVDTGSFNKFNAILKQADNSVVAMTTGVVREFAKVDAAIIGSFAAVGTGVMALADKTAMADQKYRLFGLRMLMGKDQARAMQMALDSLGATMDEVAYDPELNKRFQDLMERNIALGKSLGPLFDKDMIGIRSLRTEFKQFGTELEFLSMGAVGKLYEKLGYGSGDLLADLRKLNDTFVDQLPMWADKASSSLVPVWKDFLVVMGDVKTNAESVSIAFTNMVGILSGDQSIQGATFDIDKLATALLHVADAATKVVTTTAGVVNEGAKDATAMSYFLSYQWKAQQARFARSRARDAQDPESAQMLQSHADALQADADADWNKYIGTAQTTAGYNAKWGGDQAGVNAATAPVLGLNPLKGIAIPASVLAAADQWQSTHAGGRSFTGLSKTLDPTALSKWINDAAAASGIEPNMLAAIMLRESSGNPNAVNLDTGAAGLGQFMSGTAAQYGLKDRTNPQDSLMAMGRYLSDLLKANGGDWNATLKSYGGFTTKDPSGYIGDIGQIYSRLGGGGITIQNQTIVVPPGTSEAGASAIVSDALRNVLATRDKRLMAQTAGGAYP